MVDIIKKDAGGEIRCNGLDDPQRPHNGLIARWTPRGLLLWCGDCRQPNGKRGRQHLVTWPQVLGIFLETGDNHVHFDGDGTDSPNCQT